MGAAVQSDRRVLDGRADLATQCLKNEEGLELRIRGSAAAAPVAAAFQNLHSFSVPRFRPFFDAKFSPRLSLFRHFPAAAPSLSAPLRFFLFLFLNH